MAITFEPEMANAINLVKGSFISNKNLSEMLPSSGQAQSQVTWAKMAKNLLHLWRHPQKTEIQNEN